MAAVKGFSRFFRIFRAPPSHPGVERQFSEPSSTHTCECSRVPAQFHAQSLLTWTLCVKARVKNNNNNNTTAFLEQLTVSPNPGGGLQHFQPVQGSAASSSVSRGHDGEGFFSHFSPDKKSSTQPAHSWSALPPHSSPWTPAPCGVPMVLEEEEESELDEAEEVEEVAMAVEYVECSGRWWGATVGPDGAAVLLVARCG